MTGSPTTSSNSDDVVFLFDVDNTLIDSDRIIADLRRHLTREVGAPQTAEYFQMLEALRSELGYADYLGALQRYRVAHPREPNLIAVSHFLINYPFANRLYPGSLDAVEHCARFGRTVILSDGDVVFQPRKVERSGLFEIFEGRVLIYIHKEQELSDVEKRFPATRYVLIDDKLPILTTVKQIWADRVTTIFPRQGHYARTAPLDAYPAPDLSIERISQLTNYNLTDLLAAAAPPSRAATLTAAR